MSLAAPANIHIGTSGWHYKSWVGNFYPDSLTPPEMLVWYSRRFSTVELNNSFYRLPASADFQRWKVTVPAGFCFSVKVSRYITHSKRLHDVGDAMRNFLSRAKTLREKLGPILFQLPANSRPDPERLDEVLSLLPENHRYVFEFRDIRWYAPEIYEVLNRHRAAVCVHDWHASQWPVEFTANFTYVRLHGPTGTYSGGYSKAKLQSWARNFRNWSTRLEDIFIYFNNDQQGHAPKDAMFLQRLLRKDPTNRAA